MSILLVLGFVFVGILLAPLLNATVSSWASDKPFCVCASERRSVLYLHLFCFVRWCIFRVRCGACSYTLPLSYLTIELLLGILWGIAAYTQDSWYQALAVAVFYTLLLGVSVSDLETYIIPDELSVGGMLLGVILSLLPGGLGILPSLGGVLFGFMALYLVAVFGSWLFKKEAMGGGDIKLAAMIGAFLGYQGVVLTLFLGSLLGIIIFGPINYRTKRLVPFGVFLALGALVTHLWGNKMVALYISYLYY